MNQLALIIIPIYALIGFVYVVERYEPLGDKRTWFSAMYWLALVLFWPLFMLVEVLTAEQKQGDRRDDYDD